jgi:hypothetical protein
VLTEQRPQLRLLSPEQQQQSNAQQVQRSRQSSQNACWASNYPTQC